MNPTRETIMAALETILGGSGAFLTTGRNFTNWQKVDQQPALFVCDVKENVQRDGQGLPPKVTIQVEAWIYTKTDASPASPSAALNNLIDVVESALAPAPGSGTQTLGGLVQHCWIEGDIDKAPGYLGAQAIAVVPIKILVP